jgi:hypothetical protein
MGVAGLAATLFVLARWLDAAQRQLGHFVVAGSAYVSPNRATRGLPIGPGNGYDGQFYYRLALDPFDLARTAFGIRFDSFSRTERIGYPFLSWLVAGGHHGLVPLAMVIVNVVACSVLALAGGLFAKSAGRHALWGLVFAGYWGYLWTLGRDLSELTTAAFLLLGLAALVRHAPIWSGLAFLGAVVSKETAVLLVGTLALVTLFLRLTERPSLLASATTAPSAGPESRGAGRLLAPQRSDLAFLIPLVGFVAWQVVLVVATGRLPIYKSGGENLALPFVGLYHGAVHYFSIFPNVASALWIGELFVLILLSAGAAVFIRTAPSEFRWMWGVSVVLALCAAVGIWLGDVGFRSLDDAYLFSWVVLIYRPQRIWPGAVICAGVWCAVAVELIRYI